MVPALDHPADRPDGDRWQLAALASLVDFSAGDPWGLAVVVAVFGGGAAGLQSSTSGRSWLGDGLHQATTGAGIVVVVVVAWIIHRGHQDKADQPYKGGGQAGAKFEARADIEEFTHGPAVNVLRIVMKVCARPWDAPGDQGP